MDVWCTLALSVSLSLAVSFIQQVCNLIGEFGLLTFKVISNDLLLSLKWLAVFILISVGLLVGLAASRLCGNNYLPLMLGSFICLLMAGLPVMKSFSFCLSWKVFIFPSFMKESFAG